MRCGGSAGSSPSHLAEFAGSRITGIRSWIGAHTSLGVVVMMVHGGSDGPPLHSSPHHGRPLLPGAVKTVLANNSTSVMYGWLNMHAGRGNFAIHSAPNDLRAVLGMDATHFHFVDIDVAKAFVERFACGRAVIEPAHRGI
jgi:hypothetical protein